MRCGRRALLGIFALAVLAGAAAASAQSLGEVARKSREDKARRKARGDTPPNGSDNSFTDKDLEEAEGQGFSVMGAAPNPEKAPTDASPRDETPLGNAARDQDHKQRREAWAKRWQEQMDEAQKTLEKAEGDAYQCQAASRYFYVPIPINCASVPGRIVRARERVEHLRRNRYSWDGSENDQ